MDSPYIVHDEKAAPGTIDDTTPEKGTQEEEPVDELCAGASKPDFVAEPVDVEEWGGKLEKYEYWGVKVDEGTLFGVISRVTLTSLAMP